MNGEFNLKIKLLTPRVIDLSVECHTELYVIEKAFEHILRDNPHIKEAIGRALMHSMSPRSKDSFIIYDGGSNSN